MRRRAQAGFTLIELVVALVLLGAMMTLLYSGITFGLRSWDAGDVNGRRMADRRIGENFLRRELAETFPMRWKDPMELRFAFEGEAHALRFVSSRPAGIAQGGLALVSIDVEDDPKHPGTTNLVMRRALADPDAADFTPLAQAEPSILVEEVQEVEFSYFGSENDFADPRWLPSWPYKSRMPEAVRVRMKAADGTPFPDVLVKLGLGEEAGCLETSLQRGCRPRRT
ncbi:MAG TPA: prepilin-type N-terminal cleavage/methylation domain-containing protein [Usitatibacter sp.]|nr:prepilin-type N-terminal cleavage/methylation domain-containing protein [Usitatibacter sp.]